TCRLQEDAQLAGDHFAVAWLGTGLAVSHACSIVGANMGEFCDLRLDSAPRNIRIAKAGVEDDGGSSHSFADDVHLTPVDLDQSAFHLVEAPIASFKDVFVEESADRQEHHDK